MPNEIAFNDGIYGDINNDNTLFHEICRHIEYSKMINEIAFNDDIYYVDRNDENILFHEILKRFKKKVVYMIMQILYNETSYIWLSLGLYSYINKELVEQDRVFTHLSSNIPPELIRHIVLFLPKENYLNLDDKLKYCYLCKNKHGFIKKYCTYYNGFMKMNLGVDKDFRYCHYQDNYLHIN